jgi:hypothetical protein
MRTSSSMTFATNDERTAKRVSDALGTATGEGNVAVCTINRRRPTAWAPLRALASPELRRLHRRVANVREHLGQIAHVEQRPAHAVRFYIAFMNGRLNHARIPMP